MIDRLGKNLCFILGVPRSGTTLLSVLLGKHPKVLAPSEPWIMLGLAEMGRVNPRHPADSQLLGAACAGFLDGIEIDAARAFAQAAYGVRLAREGRQIFVDKTPRYYHIVDFIRRVFPHAKALVLLRNPLDIAASYLSSWNADLAELIESGTDHPFLFDYLLGLRRMAELTTNKGAAVLCLHYEDLVAAPEAIMARVFSFLGLKPPKGKGSDLGQVNRQPSDFGDHKILATRSVHSESVGAWRRQLSPDQIKTLVGALGAPLFDQLGYGQVPTEIETQGIPLPEARLAQDRWELASRLVTRRCEDIDLTATRKRPLVGGVQENLSAVLRGQVEEPVDNVVRRLAERDDESREHLRMIARLEAWLRDSEADRRARGEQIEELTAQIREIDVDRQSRGNQVETLTAQIKEVEADRRERGEQIEKLTAQIREIELDRQARGEQIEKLTAQIGDIDADRHARAEQIQELTTLIGFLESDRADRWQQIQTLTAMVRRLEAGIG